MNITTNPNAPDRGFMTDGEMNRVAELEKLRRTDPHAALLAGTLAIKIEDALDQSIGNRLGILRKLNAALDVERERGKSRSWLYDVNRHVNIALLWEHELVTLSGRLWTLDDQQIGEVKAFLDEAQAA